MLNLFIPLQETAAANGSSGAINLIMIVGLIVVFYFFMIRPQQKRQKEIRKFRDGLTVGSKVLTAGGIHGKIRTVKEGSFVVEIAPNVQITVEKGSVYPLGSNQQELENATNANSASK